MSMYYEENQYSIGGEGGLMSLLFVLKPSKIVTSATLGFIHKSSCCLSFGQSHSELPEKKRSMSSYEKGTACRQVDTSVLNAGTKKKRLPVKAPSFDLLKCIATLSV